MGNEKGGEKRKKKKKKKKSLVELEGKTGYKLLTLN